MHLALWALRRNVTSLPYMYSYMTSRADDRVIVIVRRLDKMYVQTLRSRRVLRIPNQADARADAETARYLEHNC